MAKKKRHTIVRVHVENFRRLRVAEVELDGEAGLVTVTGKKAAGKTSLLASIAAAMGGQGEVGERAVTDGAGGRGKTVITLSNGMTIMRKYTPAAPKGYLTITDASGETSSQQGTINEMLGPHSFDPLALLTLDLEKQRKVLLDCGKDPELSLKLDALHLKQKKTYASRTPFISDQMRASKVEKPEGLRPEAPDTAGKLEQLQALRIQQEKRRDLAHQVSMQEQRLTTTVQAIENGEATIASLKRQLEQAQEIQQRNQDNLKAQTERRDTLQAQLDRTEDLTEAMQEIQVELAQADAIHEQLIVWRDWDAAQISHRKATAERDRLTSHLEKLKGDETRLIAEAGIPVAGLSFSEEGQPLLNKRPLSVASGGERIEMAVAVAIAQNPTVGVCLVNEANDLDLESMADLRKLAIKHGFQIWACRLGIEGHGEIVVDDGVAMNRDAA